MLLRVQHTFADQTSAHSNLMSEIYNTEAICLCIAEFVEAVMTEGKMSEDLIGAPTLH